MKPLILTRLALSYADMYARIKQTIANVSMINVILGRCSEE